MDSNTNYSNVDGEQTVAKRSIEISVHDDIVFTVIVGTILLLLIFMLYVYVRWLLFGQAPARFRRQRAHLFFAGGELDAAPACRGLDPESLRSLPAVVYTATADAEAVEECAVCLTVFEVGETVRSLPRCGHRFHMECIDMWFHSHATCPLCRCAVKPAESLTVTAGAAELRIDIADEGGGGFPR